MDKHKIPKNVFELPYKYRFTFVNKGDSYFEGFVVNVSEKVKSIRRAYYIACETYLKQNEGKSILSTAVFYGDIEAPDCKDTLYEAYSLFHKKKIKIRKKR